MSKALHFVTQITVLTALLYSNHKLYSLLTQYVRHSNQLYNLDAMKAVQPGLSRISVGLSSFK